MIEIAAIAVFLAVAVRAVVSVLPVPLRAERRQAAIVVFVAAASPGLADCLAEGEYVWHAGNGAALGRVVSVRSRPASGSTGSGWSARRDFLVRLAGAGRYQAGKGLYLGRNMPIRVGEIYPLRTTLGAFRGKVEEIALVIPGGEP